MIFLYSNLLIAILSFIFLQLNLLEKIIRIKNIGAKIFMYLNLRSLKLLKQQYNDLYIPETKFYKSIKLISAYFILTLVFKLNQSTFCCVISMIFILYEFSLINLRIVFRKKYLESKLYHLIYCLEILCLRNYINLIEALKEIKNNSEKEFSDFLNQILEDYTISNSIRIEDFFPESMNYSREIKSLLSRIYSFNEYESLENYFRSLKNKIELDQELKRNNLIENIQLYLCLPIIIMMFSASYPMYSSILFSLKGINN